MKPIEILIEMYGTPTQAARALGLGGRQVIEAWVKHGYIPYKQATLVQQKTGGAIKNTQVWLAADKARGL